MKLRLFSKKKIAHIRNILNTMCTQTRFVSSGGKKQPPHMQTTAMFLIPHFHMCVHVGTCVYMHVHVCAHWGAGLKHLMYKTLVIMPL